MEYFRGAISREGDAIPHIEITSADITQYAKDFDERAILSPITNDSDDAQAYRERLVRAFVSLTNELLLQGVLQKCDTVLVDQYSANLVGVYFNTLISLIRGGANVPSHDVVGKTAPDELEHQFQSHLNDGTLGTSVLIVTENAESGKTCEAFAEALRVVSKKAHTEIAVVIATLSAQPKFSKVEPPSAEGRQDHWVVGQFNSAIGSVALGRDELKDASLTAIGEKDMEALAHKVYGHIRA